MNHLRKILDLLEQAEKLMRASGAKGEAVNSFHYHTNESWRAVFKLMEHKSMNGVVEQIMEHF